MTANKNANLSAVVHTLNTIEVHGRENLDRLLGCIQVLEGMLAPAPARQGEEEAHG